MKKSLTFLLLVIGLSSCVKKQQVTITFAERIDSLLDKELITDGPGGVVMVMKGDCVAYAKSYGLADLKTQAPITTKTLFNLGSVTKTVVANAILLLQQQGKLSVEDSLYQYFPDLRNKTIAQKIKIKHLLTHTSGLPDNRKVNNDTVFYLTAKDAENWAPELSVDTLNFEPGTNYEYSNPAFNGLALIIEKVSGQKWQDFITKNILIPSGMVTTTITDGPHPSSGVAHGYAKIKGQWTEDDYMEEPTFAAAGNGGVWSSVEELALYEKAIRSATFLNAEVIEESRTVKNHFPVKALSSLEHQEWNLGWSWFISSTKNGVKLVSHAGTQGGFYVNSISVPDKHVLFILLANFPCDREKISTQIMSAIENENYFDKK